MLLKNVCFQLQIIFNHLKWQFLVLIFFQIYSSMESEIGLGSAIAMCVFVKTEDWKIIFPAPESLAWRVAGNERACLPDCCVLVSEKVGKGALV